MVISYKERQFKKQRKKELEQHEQQHQVLNDTQDNQLSEVMNQVLDTYDRQGIRVPLDIIEDLQHTEFNSVQSCINAIEQQRYNWKLENGKKVIK